MQTNVKKSRKARRNTTGLYDSVQCCLNLWAQQIADDLRRDPVAMPCEQMPRRWSEAQEYRHA